MRPSKIIAIDSQQNGYGLSPEELSQLVLDRREEGWQLTQDKDTLFVSHPTDNKGTVEFDIMTADFSTAPTSCQVFFKMLKRAGAKQVFSTYVNPKLTEVFKDVKGYSPKFTKGEEITMKVRL